MDSPDIIVCPKCGKVSNWVDYNGSQYKEICPFCNASLMDNGKDSEVSYGNEKDENSG